MVLKGSRLPKRDQKGELLVFGAEQRENVIRSRWLERIECPGVRKIPGETCFLFFCNTFFEQVCVACFSELGVIFGACGAVGCHFLVIL